MTYDDAIDYLESLMRFGVNLGLDRMRTLLVALGSPEKTLRCIHVAGTNGKGSVTAMVASILTKAGYKVGRYVSPHLTSYTERFCIDGQEIPRDRFAKLVEGIETAIAKSGLSESDLPTEFEVLTAMAFVYFAEEHVDFAVIEVGLGGRLDATNVIEPLISVITHIGLDHVDRLGKTLPEIAYEKCGIIKPNVPVVSAVQEPEVIGVIERVCAERNSVLSIVEQNIRYEILSQSLDGSRVTVSGDGGIVPDIFIPLRGSFQPQNCACVVGVIWQLQAYGVFIDANTVKAGIAAVAWPGRLEILKREPMVVLDVGHNVDAAEQLRESIEKLFKYDRLILVIGLLSDKDVVGYLDVVAPLADLVFATEPASSRALPARALAALLERFKHDVVVVEEPTYAIDAAMKEASTGDLVLVCGSFYLVGQVRPHLQRVEKKPCMIFAGAFGSGKTETALNYALANVSTGRKTALVDLDIINPYFRSRSMKDKFETLGVRIVSSSIAEFGSEIPALSPEINGVIDDPEYDVVFDVGGEDTGATVLGRFRESLQAVGYEMCVVVNPYRPFTTTAEDVKDIISKIESASGLEVSGIVGNPNMGAETCLLHLSEGYSKIKEIAAVINLPVKFICINERLSKEVHEMNIDEEIVFIRLFMRPPWIDEQFLVRRGE